MYRRAAIVALFLLAVPNAVPQQRPPDAEPGPIVLKSSSRAVQLDVFVNDPSGRPVHGLQKNAFDVTDNGQPRDIRIFAGEIDADRTGVYSNRLSMPESRVVTAIVIDAVPRPEGLQKNTGLFAASKPEFWFLWVRGQALSAINRMEPGQTMAIYAACPDLRLVQDYTSDPDRLAASLKAFVPPGLPNAAGMKQPGTIEALVPPMLSALRDVAGRMSGASGRKSVVWISQAYGTELNLSAVSDATDSAAAAFNDANVVLYAVDTRFSPTCLGPARFSSGIPDPGRIEQTSIDTLTCSQPPDVSDEWMQYLAQATGGRAFSGGKVFAIQFRDERSRTTWGRYESDSDHGIISDALHFAADDSGYAYQMGFYVPESELDGKVHRLNVTVPAKPKFGLRYRGGYTASANATAPPAAQELANPGALNPDEVEIDAKVEMAAKNQLRVSLALAPETVTRAADGTIVLDATFTQTDDAGKQLAKVQETVRVPSPETPTGMVQYARDMKLINGAVLLHITIRDQATNRAGSVAIPIAKQ